MSATQSTTTTGLTMAIPSLTTTFTPTATTCTQHLLTMLANMEYEIWVNMPVPVPGTTFSDCYPSQYITSFLQLARGVTQAAFNPLICPVDYSTVATYTSNYIACCPRYVLPIYILSIRGRANSRISGYSFTPPETSPPADRPAFGGTCYSPIYEATPIIVTQYGSASLTAITTFSTTVTTAQVYAYPYDGYAYVVAEVSSITSGVTTTTSSVTTTTSGITTTTSGVTTTTAATRTVSSIPGLC
jgi:hypothetical protein